MQGFSVTSLTFPFAKATGENPLGVWSSLSQPPHPCDHRPAPRPGGDLPSAAGHTPAGRRLNPSPLWWKLTQIHLNLLFLLWLWLFLAPPPLTWDLLPLPLNVSATPWTGPFEWQVWTVSRGCVKVTPLVLWLCLTSASCSCCCASQVHHSENVFPEFCKKDQWDLQMVSKDKYSW